MADKSEVLHVGKSKKLKVDIWLTPFRWYITLKVKGSDMDACWPDYNQLASAPMQEEDWQSLIDWLTVNGVSTAKIQKELRELYETYNRLDALLMDGQIVGLEMPINRDGQWYAWYRDVGGLDAGTAGALVYAGITPEELISIPDKDLETIRLLGKKRTQAVIALKMRLLLCQ